MTKTKSLVTIIIFLLITNIGMLLFFVFSSKTSLKREYKHEQGGGSMYNSLQNDVGFSKDQLDRYQHLRQQQRDIVRPLFGELRTSKKDFYDLLYTNNVSDFRNIKDFKILNPLKNSIL